MKFFCIATASIRGQVEWFKNFCLFLFFLSLNLPEVHLERSERVFPVLFCVSIQPVSTPQLYFLPVTEVVRLGGFGWVVFFSPLSCLVSKTGLWCRPVDMACPSSEMALSSQLECEVYDLCSLGKVHYLENIQNIQYIIWRIFPLENTQLILSQVTLADIRYLHRSW